MVDEASVSLVSPAKECMDQLILSSVCLVRSASEVAYDGNQLFIVFYDSCFEWTAL